MGANFGKQIHLSIFGESHGKAIGIQMDGLPSGLELDMDLIGQEMARRAPGGSALSTSRKEADRVEIVSGFYQGKTTGTPLCALIYNTDMHSKDYSHLMDTVRPGHADYPAMARYDGFQDPRGGGHFSGRITAPLVFAGAVCKQILALRGIYVGAHISGIGNVTDAPFEKMDRELFEKLRAQELPLLDESKREAMRQTILEAKEALDSVGGTLECAVIGLPAGVGDPFFDSMESTLSHLLFSVPAVKGVQFGAGFAMASMRGSECNDAYRYVDGKVVTETNRCGGILGGLTTGMPLVFSVVIRPTPSVAKKQQTVSLVQGENAELEIVGRHDPCILPRAVPVIEAVAAIGVLEMIKEREACRI